MNKAELIKFLQAQGAEQKVYADQWKQRDELQFNYYSGQYVAFIRAAGFVEDFLDESISNVPAEPEANDVPIHWATCNYECSSCHNTWSLDEGFRIDTGLCAGCQKWDDEKPKRDAEDKQREAFENAYTGFPYIAGDPFW